jgi:hypothetical protein
LHARYRHILGSRTAAVPDERGGNRHARPNATAPHLDYTGAAFRVRFCRVFRSFDHERSAFREQSADDSPFLIAELDFQWVSPAFGEVADRRAGT